MPIQYSMRGYTFLDDAYTGGGGFLDGTYLLRHPREDDAKIAYRQELSYYSNFVKPVVDSLTNPIFRKMIARDWSKGKAQFLPPFMHDVDRLGSTMNRFMKNAARYARLYGSVFIMVDNSREVSSNALSALDERKYPWQQLLIWFSITMQKVKTRFNSCKDFFTDAKGSGSRSMCLHGRAI